MSYAHLSHIFTRDLEMCFGRSKITVFRFYIVNGLRLIVGGAAAVCRHVHYAAAAAVADDNDFYTLDGTLNIKYERNSSNRHFFRYEMLLAG